MPADPLLGVFSHWVRGVFSWIVAPWIFAGPRTNALLQMLGDTPRSTLFRCWLWGFGGLTFGLTMRYLGMSLGMAVGLGLTTIIETMGPPIFHGSLAGLATRLVWLGIGTLIASTIVIGVGNYLAA